jgi:ethanolamine utilization protein EutQ (cupin superfamily)
MSRGFTKGTKNKLAEFIIKQLEKQPCSAQYISKLIVYQNIFGQSRISSSKISSIMRELKKDGKVNYTSSNNVHIWRLIKNE